jgi:hypothetical protein
MNKVKDDLRRIVPRTPARIQNLPELRRWNSEMTREIRKAEKIGLQAVKELIRLVEQVNQQFWRRRGGLKWH